MPAYRRTVLATTRLLASGVNQASATVEDWFHGFEVSLDFRDGELVNSAASSFRYPWNTCPGALTSVTHLSGKADELADAIIAAPRDTTCVHLNDLVWLAARQHATRRYDIEVTPSLATMQRDGLPLLSWRLHHWAILGTGVLSGLAMSDSRWRERLDQIAADADLREAIKVLRRGVLVAMGYYQLDWDNIDRATDIPPETMANACHTFSDARVASAHCRVEVPDRRSRPRP